MFSLKFVYHTLFVDAFGSLCPLGPYLTLAEAQIAPAAPIIECGCAGMFNVLPPHTSQLDCLFVIIYC